MFRRILVTLDGSQLAERALKPAFAMAEKFGSEVLLLRVPLVQQYVTLPSGTGTLVTEQYLERDREETEAYLRAVKTQWTGVAPKVRTEAISGEPASVILDVARSESVDTIVMSTHGRSGLSRLLYGSVAESVLRGATVPVLLIPMKEA
jgi:nucleotide-binding universal stress UspA family protein